MLFVTDKTTLFRKCNKALKMGGKLYFEDLLVNKRVNPTSYEREGF